MRDPSSIRGLSRGTELALVTAMVALAFGLRVWSLAAGVPHAVGIDEPAIVDRAVRIMRTGHWNPHIFDYPTLVIYLHALVAIARFLLGAVRGEWASLAAFDISAIYHTGRLVTVIIGTATVWLTYRLGRDLDSAPLGLIAGFQLALLPMHVRESRFILTDVPVTALTTLVLWLAWRAARVGTPRAYAWAGAAAGLAAAAKYNGVVAVVPIVVAWFLAERSSPDRFRKAAAAFGALAAGFLAGAPFTVLDLPGFLNGFAAQMTRFAAPARLDREPAWSLYLKHLALNGSLWLPAAALGAVIVLARRSTRVRWLIPLGFAAAYYAVISTRSLVFARYALPLAPVICLLAAVPVTELARGAERIRRARVNSSAARSRYATLTNPPVVAALLLLAGGVALMMSFAIGSVRWLKELKRPDTRQITAEWMSANIPRGSRIAVESSGPTYLDAPGFEVLHVELLREHPADWYRSRVDYLVISTANLDSYNEFLNAGTTVFQIPATAQRWGPPIQVVRIGKQ